MLDELRPPPVHKAARQRAGEPQPRIDLAQKQRPAITAEVAAGKIRHHFQWTEVLKKQRLTETLCLTGVGGWFGCKFFHTNYNRPAAASVASF